MDVTDIQKAIHSNIGSRTMNDTQLASQRLTEALVDLETSTAGGLTGLTYPFPELISFTQSQGMPALAEVWRRFSELCACIENDLMEVHHG